MFRYICMILGDFQSWISLKLLSFYIIEISLKLSNYNIYVVDYDKNVSKLGSDFNINIVKIKNIYCT